MEKKPPSKQDLVPVELMPEAEEEHELSPEQELFCLEYLKDFNASAAAKRAGYAEKSSRQMGYELLTRPYIQRRIHDQLMEVLGDAKEDIALIIKELKMIAFSDIKDVVDWSNEGRELLDVETQKKHFSFRTTIRAPAELGDKSRAIMEISETEGAMSSSRKVKMYDKLRAIELLGKYYKMFTEKIELSNPDGNLKPRVFVYLPKNGRES